jgi:integrase
MPIQAYIDSLIIAAKSPHTIRTHTEHLRHIARSLKQPPETITETQLHHWLAGRDWMPETRRSVYRALKGFYSVLATSNPAVTLPSIPASLPAPNPVPEPLYQAALRNADPRTMLILMLSGQAGLRRTEIALTHRTDIIKDYDDYSLIVHGKGNRQRTVPLNPQLARLLLAATQDGYAFPGQINGHLSSSHVGKLAAAALHPYHLHQCRHRFASTTFGASNNLLAVQQLLGHSSPATTQRYVLVRSDTLREVALLAA